MSRFCYRHGRQILLTGANLWVGAYCDTPLGCNPPETQVSRGGGGVWGGPTGQATQSCDWLSKRPMMMSPHLKGGQNSPTAARYATISGPISPPSSLLVPPGPRQQTQSPMIMLKPRGPVPLVGGQGWALDGWNLGPKWDVKLTIFLVIK